MIAKVSDYIGQIKDIIDRAENFKAEKTAVSDVVDEEGLQYVDLVQEGGGVLGIALVGYTYILETAGIRFYSLAGTSAGAINTMMLASLGTINQPKSEAILECLVQKNLFDLVDGDKSIKKLIQSYVKGEVSWIRGRTILQLIKAILILFCRLGINPGKDFEDWISGILEKKQIRNTDDLIALRKRLPVINLRGSNRRLTSEPRLVIVTSDLTTQSKVHFPEMNELYWKNPGKVNPARYVRASMSIPLFFRPMKVKGIPRGKEARERWRHYVRFKGEKLPKCVRFVDGGLLSNFPINVFHNSTIIPSRPTFGVRLSADRKTLNKTNRLVPFLGSMIKTMRHLYDADFLLKHPDYWRLICRLDTDNEFNWLDFNMSDKDKLKLFEVGARGAMEFLEGFDWEEYKRDRIRIYNL
jgi:NTE family protein